MHWNLLPPEIGMITISGSINGRDALWDADASGWVMSADQILLQADINRKNPKAAIARGKCDELWLVIVTDTFSLSEPAEFTGEALSAPYHYLFDRVYVFDPHPPRASRLKQAT